jgi:hypothetical protein
MGTVRKRPRESSSSEAPQLADVDLDAFNINNPSDDAGARDRHFRDLYKKPPDFKALAGLDADFAGL